MPAQTKDQLIQDFEAKNPRLKGNVRGFNTYLLKVFGRTVENYENRLATTSAALDDERGRYKSDREAVDREMVKLKAEVEKLKSGGYTLPDEEVKTE